MAHEQDDGFTTVNRNQRVAKPRGGSLGSVSRSPAYGPRVTRSPGMGGAYEKRSRAPGTPLSMAAPQFSTPAYQSKHGDVVPRQSPGMSPLGGRMQNAKQPEPASTYSEADLAGASKFERELHSALEQLHNRHETRKLTAIMSSNQDAEFPSEQISGTFSWKGDNTAQNAVYLGIQQQYLFWKHTWMYNDEETQLSEGLPTFNFHLMATLACAMDTYWFSENQQLQLFDWLRDMVSGAELEPLRLENEKLSLECFANKKHVYELEGKLTSLKQFQNMGGTTMTMPFTVLIMLLAVAVGHILTIHLMK